MTYVVAAYWRAKEGEGDYVADVLARNAALSREEPGCLVFIGHRSVEDPRNFFLYEQYVDEAAYRAHNETEHFKTLVLGEAVPRLESRERTYYEPLD